MSKNNDSQHAPLHEWQVGHLRLTVFLDPSWTVPEIGWWQNVVGEPPESRTSHPKSEKLVEQGPFESGMLTLSIQPPAL